MGGTLSGQLSRSRASGRRGDRPHRRPGIGCRAPYEAAIRSARQIGFVHNEAIANELAARFYAARGFDTISHAYFRNARYGYVRWGAAGKVRELDDRYPHLGTDEAAAAASPGTITTPVEHLDLATVITVSRVVSGEMVLEKLVDAVMRAAIEYAGAERAVLVLSRDGRAADRGGSNTSIDRVIVPPVRRSRNRCDAARDCGSLRSALT